MRRILWLIFALTLPAFSANHYVNTTCANNGDGTTWACAAGAGQVGGFSALPASLTRGDTYYVSGGITPAWKLNTANSSSTVITILAATQAAHGTATGWSNAFAIDDGAGNATNPIKLHSTSCAINSLQILTGYWLVDGIIGTDGINAKSSGIYLYTDCLVFSTMAGQLRIGDGTGLANGATVIMNNITLNHLEIDGQMTETTGTCTTPAVSTDQCYKSGLLGSLTGGHRGVEILFDTVTNLTLNYLYLHNVSLDPFLFGGCDEVNTPPAGSACPKSNTRQTITNVIIDHPYVYRSRSTAAAHSQGVFAEYYASSIIVRLGTFFDIEGTADMVCLTGKCTDLEFYGMQVYNDSVYNNSVDCNYNHPGTCGHVGVTKTVGDNWNTDTSHYYNSLTTLKFYNNTVVNVNTGVAGSHAGMLFNTSAWVRSHSYAASIALIGGGYIQQTGGACTSGGGSEPTWNASVGGTTADNTCTWTNKGAASSGADTRNNFFFATDSIAITQSCTSCQHDYNTFLNTTYPIGTQNTHETLTAVATSSCNAPTSNCPFQSADIAQTYNLQLLTFDTSHWGTGTDLGIAMDLTSPFSSAPYNVDPLSAPRLSSRGSFQLPGAVPWTLTVSQTGLGTGTITTADSNINCGVTCSYNNYANGTAVSMSATPSGASVFTTWIAGPCIGTNTSPCVFNITSNTAAIAQFDATPVATLSISQNSLNIGMSATFTWSCTNANQATLTNNGAVCSDSTTCTAGATTAAQIIVPYTTYTLSCTGPTGSGTANVTPTVSAFYLGVGTANGIK